MTQVPKELLNLELHLKDEHAKTVEQYRQKLLQDLKDPLKALGFISLIARASTHEAIANSLLPLSNEMREVASTSEEEEEGCGHCPACLAEKENTNQYEAPAGKTLH